MFSLAASESGDPIAGGQRAFFHRQLAHLLGLDEATFVRGFANATNMYYRLEEYLRVQCAGRRGSLLVASTSFGGKYVWRARVQVLLNASSRRQLGIYFNQRCLNRSELTKRDLSEMLSEELIRPRDSALSNSLRRTLELVSAEGNQIFGGFVELVETEYIRWFFERPDDVRRSGDSGFRRAGIVADNPALVAPTQPRARRERIERSRSEKRVVLKTQPGSRPWEIGVQARALGANWEVVECVLSWGTGSVFYELNDGSTGSLTIDDPMSFAHDGNGWLQATQLRTGDLCAILCSRIDAQSLVAAFNELRGVRSGTKGLPWGS